MAPGIYKITCKETSQCYIGQSKNIEGRWKKHHKRFSPDAYDYEVLMSCPIESLDFFERAFINGYDSHRNGFNKTVGGTSIKSTHPDAETRHKMSESLKGTTTWNIGKTLSDETKRKISEAKKGKTFTDEHRAKLSEAQKERHRKLRPELHE